jgi:transcriptional antiterminator NusG
MENSFRTVDDIDAPSWFAIRTSSNWEFRAHDDLSGRCIEVFLPRYGIKRTWSDRTKVIEQPLFPGYIFCRFHLAERVRILQARGVKQIVGIGKTPTPISEGQLDTLKALVASNLQLVPWPYLNSGQQIHIDRGPLAGVRGFLVHTEAGTVRLVASLDLVQCSVATVIDREWIGPVGNTCRGC